MPTALRALLLYLALAIPSSAILASLAGAAGAVIGLCLVLAALIGMLWTAEDSVSYRFDAEISIPPGLARSFELAIGRVDPYLERVPRLRIFSDPRPQALYARGLSGNGSIYLSRGLLATLTEEELREVMIEAYQRVTRPGARLVTLCAVLSLWLARAMPTENLKQTPFRTLRVWALWPWSRLIDVLSGKAGTPGLEKLCRAAINPWFRLPGDISL